MYIQVYLNHGPMGSGGTTVGKTIFIFHKIFSRTVNVTQTLHNSFLDKENKDCLNEGPGSRPRGDNHKNANVV